LANANVWILGLGAIGLAVLRQLVACGVKKFTLIDFDQVEISNLNRIQATRLDLGKDKVDLAAEIVNSYDLSAELNCIKLKINTQDDLSEILKNSDIDLFVLAADQPIFDIAIWSYQECFSRKVPIISGGVNIRYGSWGPFLIPSSQDYELVNERFIKFLNNAKTKLAGCSVPIGSMISTNDIVASFMANDILNFLHDQSVLSLNCLRSIDFDSAKISIQEISS
jgi:molybdopterin/thiamine biosynthesis adenylyltransferase